MGYCAVPEKNPYPPHGRSSDIPRGTGVLKVKILEAKYEAKLEFPGGRGCETKKPSKGGVRIHICIFWNYTLPYIGYMEMYNGTQKAVHFSSICKFTIRVRDFDHPLSQTVDRKNRIYLPYFDNFLQHVLKSTLGLT